MSTDRRVPSIIQGGMGVAISTWPLARAVARLGQLGVVSGTGLAGVMACRLMDGDLGGHTRRALAGFPLAEFTWPILQRYHVPGGKAPGAPYHPLPPPYTLRPPRSLDRLTAIANFVEVFLAKGGHTGPIGINLLEKVQMPTPASLYGAMLAGVDYVLMGAGIPTQIPGLLDRLSEHQPVSYRLDVQGALPSDETRIHFDPEDLFPGMSERMGPLRRPKFLPIISSVVLAQALLKRSDGAVDGFVVEGPTAGGHNAPPRGPLKLNARGEPVYGTKDLVDPEKMRQLGLPFWLAGGYGHPAQLQNALAAGAAGVQVGTAFAMCDESGLDPMLKRRLLRHVLDGTGQIFTSPNVSPTGFPFKVVQLEGTLSEKAVHEARPRVCDLGFLRTPFRKADGSLGYRCPSEPVQSYVQKGGLLADTEGRCCFCNSLLAGAGHQQQRPGGSPEPAIVTAGDDLGTVRQFIPAGQTSYSAADVVNHLLGVGQENRAENLSRAG